MDFRHGLGFGSIQEAALREVVWAKQALLETALEHGKPVQEYRFRPAIYQIL
jgi:hypothetical protein